MKVLVLGAGGIVGQHMMLKIPKDIQSVFSRKTETPVFRGLDVDSDKLNGFLDDHKPDVIVNLAGENRVDVVEADPEASVGVNVKAVAYIASWCNWNGTHLVQVSTQGVFSGNNAPYSPMHIPDPITAYGKQKTEAESMVDEDWTIARLTFILGIRPWEIGRVNPVESMFTSAEQLQVNDRWFSPCFAEDAAKQLWDLALAKQRGIFHIGTPIRTSRYEIATTIMQNFEGMGYKIIPVSHNHFAGIAPRPKDTTWASDSLYSINFSDGIRKIVRTWSDNPRTKS